MSVNAIIKDGEIANMQATSKSSEKKSGTMDKNDFLQLLVAQMKYQDPLEPTSNTEYVSQYAQFSEVEQMQNMSQNMDLSRASSLVGQTVEITSTDDDGKETTVMGKVDYVKYESGKAKVSIDETLYDLDDITHVCDKEYLDAYNKAADFVSKYAKFPALDKVTMADKGQIEELLDTYSKLNDYEKTFIHSSISTGLEKYRVKLDEVVKDSEKNTDNKDSEGNGSPESTENI